MEQMRIKNVKGKILSAILVLCMMLTFIPLNALADGGIPAGAVVTVDKELIINNAVTPVKITVKSAEGLALSGKNVAIDAPGIHQDGQTDGNGEITFNINPNGFSGNFNVNVEGTSYWNMFYSGTPTQGLVKVKMKDILGSFLNNFDLQVRSDHMGWGTNTYNGVCVVLAESGTNWVTASHNGDLDDGYYLTSTINVVAGQVNQVTVDGSNSVEENLSFSYGGNPITNASICADCQDAGFQNFAEVVGNVDSQGSKKVHVTPGTYKYTIISFQNSIDRVVFSTSNESCTTSGPHSYGWSSGNTGLISFNLGNIGPNATQRIDFEGAPVYFNSGTTIVRMSEGVHGISYVEYHDNNTGDSYGYGSGQVDITAGQTQQYDFTMTKKSVDLMLFNDPQLGNDVSFGVNLETNSNHVLTNLNGDSSMHVTITDPDGKTVQDTNCWFRGGHFSLNQNAPKGTYTIHATGSLGSLYGAYDLTTTFNVTGNPVVTVDKELISYNGETPVTITVKSQEGTALPGKNVAIDGPSHQDGQTDVNGQITFNVNPNGYTGGFYVNVDGTGYGGMFFAGSPTQGLVKVRMKDVLGNFLGGFSVDVRSDHMGWGTYSNNGVALALAEAGQNRVMAACATEEGYYLSDTINVVAGSVNEVVLDGANSVEENLSFSYSGDPITNAFLDVDCKDTGFENFVQQVGSLNNGSMKVHLTPGTYNFTVASVPNTSDHIIFSTDSEHFSNNGANSYAWDSSNTGLVNFNLEGLGQNASQFIYFDGAYVQFNGGTTLARMNTGNHYVNLQYDNYNSNEYYQYNKNGQQDVINVVSGQTQQYNFVKTQKSIDLKVFTDNIQAGYDVRFGVELDTNSDHTLTDAWGNINNSMHVTINDPLGNQVQDGYWWFRDGHFYLPIGAPKGTYTIHATGSLGSLYGSYDLTTTFDYGTHPVLTWYLVGSPQPGTNAVCAAASDYLMSQYGIDVKINLKYLDWGSYFQQMSSKITDGEPFDICFTAGWASGETNYSIGSKNGDFLPLNDYLTNSDIPGIVGQNFLNGSKIDGVNYALPANKDDAFAYGLFLRKDLVDKYHINVNNIHTITDLDTAFAAVKSGEQGVKPLLVSEDSNPFNLLNWNYLMDENLPGALYSDNRNTTIIDQFETTEAAINLAKCHEYNTKGYMAVDDPSKTLDDMKTDNYFAVVHGLTEPFNAENVSAQTGKQWVQVNITTPHIDNQSTVGSMLAINANSQNADLALQFIDKLYTDPVLKNLFDNGIEGVNYTYNNGNFQINQMDPSDSRYYMPGNAWMFGQECLDYNFADRKAAIDAYNQSAIPLNTLGFQFDPQPVNDKIAAVRAVEAKYYKSLFTGSADPSIVLPKFIAEAKAAGMDDVIAEMQNQFNNWMIANTPSTLYAVPGGQLLFNKLSQSITGYTGDLTNVTIPSQIDGVTVKGIGDLAFDSCTNLTSIVLPNTITSIGERAFGNCSVLTSISIQNGVLDIGERAFEDCTGLSNISLPSSITSIGEMTFKGCSKLSGITIPNKITTICDSTFEGCTSLTSMTIPNTVVSMGDSVFYNCSGLTGIVLPGSIDSIGNYMFYGCSKLTGVIIPNSVVNIGNSAFEGCSSLTTITIPVVTTSIGDSAFYSCTSLGAITLSGAITEISSNLFGECKSLNSITIPNNVTSISYDAFSGSGLMNITVPAGVTNIDDWAFSDCSKLTAINVNVGNPQYSSINGVLFNKAQTELIAYPGAKNGNYTIPDGVTDISSWAFGDCTGLTTVAIPDSVANIDDIAFGFCNNLSAAYFNGNAPVMGSDVFTNAADGFTVYYLANKAGFEDPWYGYTVATMSKKLTVSSTTAHPGDTIELTVSLEQGAGAAGGNFTIDYDPAKLTPLSYTAGDVLQGVTPTVNLNYIDTSDGNKSKVRITYAGVSGTSTGGDIIKVKFKVSQSIQNNGIIPVTLKDFNLYDQNSTPISSQVVAGQVAVTVIRMGDVNLDSTVDAADAVMILRKDAGFITLTSDQSLGADVNGDSKIDSGDAIRILRYDAGLINDVVTGQ